ncbi:MAG TPA: glycosyl hydrolase family 28-related protein, partial [Bacillota bacterium]|nr:glycosyl hydrolase family 28-related protein [Bacillota bacterium]
MFPETHLVTSWVIGAKTTDNARDCRLVALAGILPDADGLGIVMDAATKAMGHKKTLFYEHYHHYLLHGAFGAILIAVLLACFARHKWRVALLALAVFHLHILCDFVGSRGPSPEDLWPIFYLGPFDKDPMWIWKGQWPLDAWPNRVLSVGLFLYALWLAVQKGYSFVGVFSRRLDERFVAILRKWQEALAGLRGRPLLLLLTATVALTSFPAGAAGVTKKLPKWAAQEVQFPADAGIIDVTAAPYGAKGDGVTDDTQAIQKAITDNMRGAILYFPNGTYLVSSTLKWSKKNSKGEECWGNFTVQGQSAAR